MTAQILWVFSLGLYFISTAAVAQNLRDCAAIIAARGASYVQPQTNEANPILYELRELRESLEARYAARPAEVRVLLSRAPEGSLNDIHVWLKTRKAATQEEREYLEIANRIAELKELELRVTEFGSSNVAIYQVIGQSDVNRFFTGLQNEFKELFASAPADEARRLLGKPLKQAGGDRIVSWLPIVGKMFLPADRAFLPDLIEPTEVAAELREKFVSFWSGENRGTSDEAWQFADMSDSFVRAFRADDNARREQAIIEEYRHANMLDHSMQGAYTLLNLIKNPDTDERRRREGKIWNLNIQFFAGRNSSGEPKITVLERLVSADDRLTPTAGGSSGRGLPKPLVDHARAAQPGGATAVGAY